MKVKEKILLVEPFVPYPLNNGGAQAILNGILAIKDNYEVYVTILWQAEASRIETFRKLVGESVHVLPQKHIVNDSRRLPFINRFVMSLFFRTQSNRYIEKPVDPFELMTHEPLPDNAFLEEVNTVIKAEGIGIVQVEMPMMMSVVLALPDSVRKVYVHHELRFVRNELEMEVAGENAYRRSAVEINKILEISLLNKYDAIITLSPVDKLKLEREGVTKPIYSSFATVTAKHKPEHYNIVEKKVSFVGPEFHVPNKKGVEWFLQKCWPLLLSKDPEYKFQIIGKWSTSTQIEYTHKYKNIIFLGFVDDLGAAIRQGVMIVPIHIGSGIRMKILEAAANGIPFVTTSVGVEGLSFNSDGECIIADGADSFVDAILCLHNVKLDNKFIDNAYNVVSTNYSLDALRRNRLTILSEVLR